MRQRPTKMGWIRALVGVTMLAGLLVGLAACWLFNIAPNAQFSVSASTGRAPLLVEFSASASSDEDGDIVEYSWSFGDGTSAQGMDVDHTFQNQGTYTVLLRVTDNYGGTDEARLTITVLAPEPPGPSASFTSSTTAGTAPLGVTFNASASSYDSGFIDRYEWDFGDGGNGIGRTTSHTYFDEGTFTVTLTVIANDGKTGTATATIDVDPIGGGGTPPVAGAPSARFTITGAGSIGVAPFEARFDPSDSEADEGRTIAQYVWSFGDGDAETDINPTEQVHVFTTDEPSETFSVTLIVLDNTGAQDSITKTVKVYNHQPVAGFEIANPPGGDAGDPGAVEGAVGTWETDDVTYGDLQSLAPFPTDVTVGIRSILTTDGDWFNLVDTGDQDTLEMAEGVAADSSTNPGTPDDYTSADDNFSYDPEGQTWAAGEPAWFPNRGWGIEAIYVDWGDGTAEQQFPYNDVGDTVMTHDYNYNGGIIARTITIRVVDYLGGEDSFSRQVILKEAEELPGDL